MSDKLLIEIPKELAEIAGISKEEINNYNMEIWVFNLYGKGSISLSRASQLLGLKIDLFVKKFRETHLKRLGGPIDIDDAIDDADAISRVLK